MTIVVFLASLLGAMAVGVPVAFALIFCGIVLMTYMGLFNTQIVAQNMIAGADTFTLLAIPFFLLAGEIMNAGGLSRRIIDFAIACVGRSEEHTSELQSLMRISYAVFCLKKTKKKHHFITSTLDYQTQQ